jgi:hypothetical protein
MIDEHTKFVVEIRKKKFWFIPYYEVIVSWDEYTNLDTYETFSYCKEEDLDKFHKRTLKYSTNYEYPKALTISRARIKSEKIIHNLCNPKPKFETVDVFIIDGE